MAKAGRVLSAALALALAGALTGGCTSSGPGSPAAGGTGSSTATGSAGSAAPTARGRSTPSSGTPAAPGRPAAAVVDARKAAPVVKAGKVGKVTYAKASAQRVRLFAPVAKASGGLTVDGSVTTVRVGGRDVGAVAVYRLKPGRGTSPMFQDQYVVQLVNAVSAAKGEPRFVRLGDRYVTFSSGSRAVAGWFDGDRVVLLYRQAATPDLAALAAAVDATPLRG